MVKCIQPPVRGQGEAWAARAEELRDWTKQTLMVRTNCHGGYWTHKDGNIHQKTVKHGLYDQTLDRHYRAGCTNDVIGLHTTRWLEVPGVPGGGVSVARLTCHDIDRHRESDDPEATWRAAKSRYDRLVDLGFRPLMLDSNGYGGYKLYVIYDEEITAQHARRFGLWLDRDWTDHGLPGPVEVFPKQPEIRRPGSSEKGTQEYGNWLRLPGRHHKRDYWTRVWDGENWVDGDDAIDAILSHDGDSPQLIPNEALEFGRDRDRERAERPACVLTDAELQGEAVKARDALRFLGPGVKDDQGREYVSDYDAWLMIGFALHSLGDVGFKVWDSWSRQCPSKYDPEVLALKWTSMSRGGITLGTLYHHARRAGWAMPPQAVSEDLTHAFVPCIEESEPELDPDSDPLLDGEKACVKSRLPEEVYDVVKKRAYLDRMKPWGEALFALIRELTPVADDQKWPMEMWERVVACWIAACEGSGIKLPRRDVVLDKLKKKLRTRIKSPHGNACKRVEESVADSAAPNGLPDFLKPVAGAMATLSEEAAQQGRTVFHASLRFIGGLAGVSYGTVKIHLEEQLFVRGYVSRIARGDQGTRPGVMASDYQWHDPPIPGKNVWNTETTRPSKKGVPA